jgi:hypothetical protein
MGIALAPVFQRTCDVGFLVWVVSYVVIIFFCSACGMDMKASPAFGANEEAWRYLWI